MVNIKGKGNTEKQCAIRVVSQRAILTVMSAIKNTSVSCKMGGKGEWGGDENHLQSEQLS